MMDLPLVAQSLDYTCGAACFDSMIRYFRGESPGEMFFAEELGTLKLGYTSPSSIVELAKKYNLSSSMVESAEIADIHASLVSGQVTFVTWWDEDAGHYSLVRHIDATHITLMDPWLARECRENRLALEAFVPHWKARGARIIRIAKHQ